MNALRTSRLGRHMSLSLALVMISSLLLTSLSVASAQTPSKKLLVLPVTTNTKDTPADLSERASSVLSLALGDVRGLKVMQFMKTSPTVRLAVSEGRLREIDVAEANRNVATALMVGAALKVDYILLTSVQSYVKKDDPASVEIIISGQMYEVAPNVDPVSGEAIASPDVYRAFGVSGTSGVRANYRGEDGPLVGEALRDAAQKAAQALSNKPTGSGQVQAPVVRKRSGNNVMVLLLVLGGLAIAAGASSGGGGGANPNALPPTNLSYSPPANSGVIYLAWNEPSGTTLTLLRYQIERRVGNGAWSGALDPGTLLPGTTSFADSTTLTGTYTYQYRLRALYTSGASSVWVTTTPTTVTR